MSYVHAYIQTCIHTSIHIYIHSCMHTHTHAHASRCTCDDSQQFGVKLMERSLAVGATSGSLSAILFRFLSSALDSPCPVFDCDCPVCSDFPALIIQKLDIFSLLVGIICGLLIGPILDLVHLVRQSWVVWLRPRLTQLAEEGPLCKLA